MQPPNHSRVILHIDFDCYYAQVEAKRLGIPRDTPLAVQQWEGLIAVNYAARAQGVTRHMRVGEARKLCPSLQLVHVETIGAEGEGSGQGGAEDPAAYQDKRLTQKASLERYRRSTQEVLALLHRLAPAAVIEKASIDEVYMDVTALVDRELQAQAEGRVPPSPVDAFSWNSIVIGGPLDVGSEFERRLAKGAEIACRLRGALLSELGYTASAGIATNKLLAKIGSAMHKPNQQTVIPPRAVQEVMRPLPLKKLRFFGGKLGAELEEQLGCSTAGEVQDLPHETLVTRFGQERAAWIEEAVRGISHEPVQERERPKSMLAAKSFNPTSDMAAIHRWFTVLAEELASRLAADEAQYRRRPRNLVVHYRSGAAAGGGGADRSKSCAMPRGPAAGERPSAAQVADAALALFKARCAQEALPCNRLAISAAEFADLPSINPNAAITRFLLPQAKAKPASGPAEAVAAPGSAAGSAAATGTSSPRQGGEPPASTLRQAQPAAARQQQQQPQQQQQQQQQPASPPITHLFDRALKRQRVGAPVEAQPASAAAQQRQEEQPPQRGVGAGAQPPPASAAADQQQQEQLAQRGVGGGAQPILQDAACSGCLLAGQPPPVQPPGAPCGSGSSGQLGPGQGGGGGLGVDRGAGSAGSEEAGCGGGQEPGGDALLAGVDVQEQLRILKEIELRRVLEEGGGGAAGAGRRGAGGGGNGSSSKPVRTSKAPGGGSGKVQRGIAAFLKQPKGSS